MDIVRAAIWVADHQHIPAEAVQWLPGAQHAHQSNERDWKKMGHSTVMGGVCKRTQQCATGLLRACKRTPQCTTGLQGEREREGEGGRAWE